MKNLQSGYLPGFGLFTGGGRGHRVPVTSPRRSKQVSGDDPGLLQLSPSSERKLVDGLLRWFYDQARDLPWRRTLDPYAIWVSEIMLQQTQVKTVIPYWQRWMQRFPDVSSLARARTDEVLKAWEGLGYYSRARNLQAAAQTVTRDFGGRFPSTHEQVLSLSGIGPYTAGAICSLAFNQPTAILDGNVERVLTRVGAVPGNPRERELKRMLWQSSARLVELASRRAPHFRPGLAGNCSAFNQSLMELGALICTPKAPRCEACPIRGLCRAFRGGEPERFPELSKRAEATRRHFHAFVLEHQGAVWVVQRPEGVVNGGLWEFPNLEVAADEPVSPVRWAQTAWGIGCPETRRLQVIRHSITRYRMELTAHVASVDRAAHRRIARWSSSASLPPGDERLPQIVPSPWMQACWVKPGEAVEKAFTAAHRRILRAWLESGRG